MKYVFLLCMVSIIGAACGSAEEKIDKQTYTAQKESIEEKEQKHPLQFLTVNGDKKKNLIGQTVMRGTITNKAITTAYKDVRVKMLCYKDGAMVEEHEDVIEETIKANGTQDFKTKYRLPKGTDSVVLSIISATANEAK